MPETEWRLGVDLIPSDNLLDGITFDDLILAVHCDCKYITPEAVAATLEDILSQRMEDMHYLLENNMEAIMKAASEGRN